MITAPPTGAVARALERTVHEAGALRVEGQRVDELLPRQVVFEIEPGHGITPVTDAARAALLASGGRLEHLVSTWAGLVDAAGGARLKAVAFTDSTAGMRLVDNLAVVDGGIGVSSLGDGKLGEILPQLTGSTAHQPAGHSISNSTRISPGEELASWVVIGPDTSADVLHFTGAREGLHESWPADVRSAGPGSEVHQKVAALAASVLAHEGTHAKLTRLEDVRKGARFPASLDEARTEYVSALTSDAAELADALGVRGAAARVEKPLADHPYSKVVTWLAGRLDEIGVPPDADSRRDFLTGTTLPDLLEQVGEPS